MKPMYHMDTCGNNKCMHVIHIVVVLGLVMVLGIPTLS